MGASEPPLIAGRIHGIRSWSLGWDGGDADLRGYGDSKWATEGEATVARCGHGRRRPTHRVPNPGCSCGLYALHPWKAALEHHYLGDLATPGLSGSVAGIVEAWGRVELHAEGFRAQFARPLALVLVGVPRASDTGIAVVRLAERYRAELIEVAGARELVEYCREHDLGLSKPVVRSLVREQPEDPPDPAPPVPSPPSRKPVPPPPSRKPVPPPPSRKPAPSRLARAGEVALTAVGVLLGVAWYGFWAYIVVMVAIDVINGDFGSKDELVPDRHLRVEDQALIRFGGELRYVAVVRNTSEKRVALAVFARGEVLDRDGDRVVRLGERRRVETRPTLLPGESGVVVDGLPRRQTRGLPERMRYETELVARREPAPKLAPPVEFGEPAFDRGRCRVEASLEAGRRARGSRVAIVTTDAAGGISAAGTVGLGRRAIERGRWGLELDKPGDCPDWLRDVDVYPALLPAQVARAGRHNG